MNIKRISYVVLLVLLILTACGISMPEESTIPVITLDNVDSLTQIRKAERKGISEIAWLSDGASIATCKDGREISILNTQTLKEEQSFTSPSDLYQGFSISPKGDHVAIITDDPRHVEIWNIKPQKLVLTLGNDEDFNLFSIVSFSPDGNSLVTGGWGEECATVMLWDLNTGGLLKEITLADVKPAYDWPIYNLVISPDGKGLAALAYDGSLHVYFDDWSFSVSGDGGHVQGAALAFSPNGDLLALGGGPFVNNLLIYDLSTTWPEVIFDLKKPNGVVKNASFNNDNTLIAAIVNGSVNLWNLKTGEHIIKLDTPRLSDVSFSPDGTLLATAGVKDGLQFWGLP